MVATGEQQSLKLQTVWENAVSEANKVSEKCMGESGMTSDCAAWQITKVLPKGLRQIQKLDSNTVRHLRSENLISCPHKQVKYSKKSPIDLSNSELCSSAGSCITASLLYRAHSETLT